MLSPACQCRGASVTVTEVAHSIEDRLKVENLFMSETHQIPIPDLWAVDGCWPPALDVLCRLLDGGLASRLCATLIQTHMHLGSAF